MDDNHPGANDKLHLGTIIIPINSLLENAKKGKYDKLRSLPYNIIIM